jgi:hypothetical protein
MRIWLFWAFDVTGTCFVRPNAAVERPRDALSSAPRVHNEMTHVRRTHADV